MNNTPASEPLLIQGFEETSLFSALRRKRGWTDEYLVAINDPHHEELKDLTTMIDALHWIRTMGKQIVVLPDFDMDGITSGVLGWAGLSELGFDVELYVPDYRRGHDITVDAVQELYQQFPQASAVITCDGGINSNTGISEIRKLGLIALVTDHHMELPPGSVADVAVNPARMNEEYAHPGICGAHVLYQVLIAYAHKYAPEKVHAIHLLKLFAGIGTVSDVMPMAYENRKLVRDSISIARLLYVSLPPEDLATVYDIETTPLMRILRAQAHHPAFVSVFEGFALVMKNFRERGKLMLISDIDEEFYGFYLAPPFNAIRRIEGSMQEAFGVFTALGTDAKSEHMATLVAYNETRKELTLKIFEQLNQEREDGLQPLSDQGVYIVDAPAGMLGLVASAIMQNTNRPTVIIKKGDDNGPLGGSARSPAWFPIISTMTPLGFTALGHENACGVRVNGLSHLVEFAQTLDEQATNIHARLTASGKLTEQQADLVLGYAPDTDGELVSTEDIMTLTKEIETIAPFGYAFPRPIIELIVDLSRCSITTLGSEKQHLRIVLPIGMKLLWWNQAGLLMDLMEKAESPIPGESIVHLLVKLSINVFQGHESVQAVVEDLLEKNVIKEHETTVDSW